MSTSFEAGPPPAPPGPNWPDDARGMVRWVCTNNPFYVVSAGLFLAGLWISCDPENAQDTWALMAGLAGYTLLLAATAFVLIRYGKVWDDARTVLLLVVLMFLATSVTFDRALIFAPFSGTICNLLGLTFAIVVSEALLFGIALKLPRGFRLPYHLLLGLFFLYPVALANGLNLRDARSEPVMWSMFGFCTAAALIFLMLLPAVRRGSDYVRNNGSPWTWPMVPWSLFGLLALAVPARAVLLCYSMHLIDVRDLYEVTFGFYFLVPFGLVLAILLLEAGLVAQRTGVIAAALAIPIGLIVLSVLGHRDERVYVEFLAIFTHRLGAGPVFCTILFAAGFFGYAALRGIPFGIEALTATLALLSCVHLGALDLRWSSLVLPHPAPWIAASTVLLGLGIWRKQSWRCLAGSLGLALSVALASPGDGEFARFRWLVVFHLVMLVVLVIGAAFDDDLAKFLRGVGSFAALLAGLGAMLLPIAPPASLPIWVVQLYPVGIALLLAGYGYGLGHPPISVLAGAAFLLWCLMSGWQVYRTVRQLIVGMDYLALSLLVFGVALAVSLSKTAAFHRWLERVRERRTEPPLE